MKYIGKAWRDTRVGDRIGTDLYACEKCGAVFTPTKSQVELEAEKAKKVK